MAGIPLMFGNQNAGSILISFFYKSNTVLTHQTALVDISGTGAYFRIYYDPDQNWIVEAAMGGVTGSLNMTPNGFVFQANKWYWLSARVGSVGGFSTFGIDAQVWGQDGTTAGEQHVHVATVNNPPNPISCALGWGVPLSSTYNPFPNALGDEMTELVIDNYWDNSGGVPGLRSVPAGPITAPTAPTTGHPTTDSIVALYHCDVPLGANQVIKDDTANGYALAPATSFNGDLIIKDSPF